MWKMCHFSRDFSQITNGEEKSARFLIHTSRRNLVSFNNRTYPPSVRDEEGYKRNCCANSKVIKPFVFLLNFVNYKKLVKKIIKSLSTAKKFSFNNRTTPRCHSSHFLKNNRPVNPSQASYLPLHFVNFHFHISQR